ncbi:hypothetical protein BDV93DRAFT_505624 [Ceratobasidium sp. AG-I]|nr:hypothetical protein BDV93DRAFT_505624 [Ceratobasidium sp. AG-I]
MEGDDNGTRPKRARKPTERGAYAESATEKIRRTREGNQQRKELAAEANSQTYSANHGVDLMFDLADSTSSSNKESDRAHLNHLIAQVAHLTGRDYSEECRQGSMGIEDLEVILDDPTAAMEESTSQLRRNTGKGKADDALPHNLTNYSGITASRDSLPAQSKQSKPKLPSAQGALLQASTPTSNSTSGLKRRLDSDNADGASKKRRADGGSTSQSNPNPPMSTPLRQSTPAAQAAKGKYPPLKKTDWILFGGRVQNPSNTIIGNYHAPSASHSRPTASGPLQQQSNTHAVGMRMIENPMLPGSGGSKPSASAAPRPTQTRAPPPPTKTTFALSPLRLANRLLSPPPHLSASNAAPASRPSASCPSASRPSASRPSASNAVSASNAGSASNAASASQSGHTTLPTRSGTLPGSVTGSHAPSHRPPVQRTPNVGSQEQAIGKGPTPNRPPTSDELPRPENIEYRSHQSKPVRRAATAVQDPINDGSRPDRARRIIARRAEEQVPARAASPVPNRRAQTPPWPRIGEQPDAQMEDADDQDPAHNNVADEGTNSTRSSVTKVLNPNKPAFERFPDAVQPVLKIASHKAKARMISCGTYNYLDSDPGEVVPTDDVIVAEAWAGACQKEDVNLTFKSTYCKYVQQRVTSWRLKSKGIIKALVDRELGFSSSRPEENIELVKKLLPEGFHTGPDEKGSLPYHSNFLLQACYEVAFGDSEAVGVEFPRLFNPLPLCFIAYICTIVNHVIYCYRDGYYKKDEHLKAEQQRLCFYQYLTDLADQEDAIPTVARNHRAVMHDSCRTLLEKSAPIRVAEELRPKRDWGDDVDTEYVSKYEVPESSDDGIMELNDDGNDDRWRVGAGGYRDAGAGDNNDDMDEPHGGHGQRPQDEYLEMEEVNGVINAAEEEEVPSDIEMDEPGEEGVHRYGGHEGEEY